MSSPVTNTAQLMSRIWRYEPRDLEALERLAAAMGYPLPWRLGIPAGVQLVLEGRNGNVVMGLLAEITFSLVPLLHPRDCASEEVWRNFLAMEEIAEKKIARDGYRLEAVQVLLHRNLQQLGERGKQFGLLFPAIEFSQYFKIVRPPEHERN